MTLQALNTALRALKISTASTPTDETSESGGVAIYTPSTSTEGVVAVRYFDIFPNFTPNHQAPLRQEFARLAKSEGWTKKSEQYKVERLRCFEMEYAHFYGEHNANNLQAWQALHEDIVRTEPVPRSIKKCREVRTNILFWMSFRSMLTQAQSLKGHFVNIFDYIDCKRAQKPVNPIFTTKKHFWNYTMQGNKFPVLATKANPTRGALLQKSRK